MNSPFFEFCDGSVVELEQVYRVSQPYESSSYATFYYGFTYRTKVNDTEIEVSMRVLDTEKENTIEIVNKNREDFIKALNDHRSGVLVATLLEKAISE
jgi:hypothetical protein